MPTERPYQNLLFEKASFLDLTFFGTSIDFPIKVWRLTFI